VSRALVTLVRDLLREVGAAWISTTNECAPAAILLSDNNLIATITNHGYSLLSAGSLV
jgi:hypothetical protein